MTSAYLTHTACNNPKDHRKPQIHLRNTLISISISNTFASIKQALIKDDQEQDPVSKKFGVMLGIDGHIKLKFTVFCSPI